MRRWTCLVGMALCGPAVAQDYPLPPAVAPEPNAPIEPANAPPPVVKPLAILGGFVLPGSVARLSWQAGQNFAGAEMHSPVVVAHGPRPGPTLCLVAGVHGDEINGVETVRRILAGLEPERLAGTVIGVPVVNLFGFQRNARYLPDRRDLNRFFPGSAQGSIASRIARSFFDEVVRRCDALVDFHTGSFDRNNLPQLRADLRRPEVLELVRGFGATVALHSDGARGMLRVAATAAGIPAVTFEAGAPARLQEDEIGTMVAAIERLMFGLGMTQTVPYQPAPQPVFYTSRWLRAERGGLLISEVVLGEEVSVGQRLGRIIDPLDDQEYEIRSSLAGRMLGMAQNQQVLPGFALFHVGLKTSAGEVVRATGVAGPDAVEEDSPGQRPREDEAPDEAEGDSGE